MTASAETGMEARPGAAAMRRRRATVTLAALLIAGGPAGARPCALRSRAKRPPLRLSSFQRAAANWYPGTQPRPLQQKLELNGRTYYVQAWIGPNTSARQRSLLAQIVASISSRASHD